MNSDLAYSCDVHSDGTIHFNIDRICMFDINLIQLDSFIMGMNEKNIYVSHDVTPEERKNLREKKKKKKNEGSICLIL